MKWAEGEISTSGATFSDQLVALVQIVGFFTWRFRNLEKFVDGVPRILVRHGEVQDSVLKEEQVTRAELLEALRRDGCSALTKVRVAMLETDGAITLVHRESK